MSEKGALTEHPPGTDAPTGHPPGDIPRAFVVHVSLSLFFGSPDLFYFFFFGDKVGPRTFSDHLLGSRNPLFFWEEGGPVLGSVPLPVLGSVPLGKGCLLATGSVP